MPEFNTISEIFNLLAEELDMSPQTFRLVLAAHRHLGEWIKKDSMTRFKADATIYTQGSMLLGTVVRPIKFGDKCDIDLIYCRQVKKTSTTQDDLKREIGEQLRAYVTSWNSIHPPAGVPAPTLKDENQCWTLTYGTSFSMDVVPSIPDEETRSKYTHEEQEGISTTNRHKKEWQDSNPKGYALWFSECDNKKILLEEDRMFTAAKAASTDVEEIPKGTASRAKTPLRRAIQILKRHRDIRYKGDQNNKPSSIIITTLATRAYNQEENVRDALLGIVRNMRHHIEQDKTTKQWIVRNPICKTRPGVEPENFADQWNAVPQKKVEFDIWLKRAELDLSSALRQQDQGFHTMTPEWSENFGADIVESAVKKYGAQMLDRRKQGVLRAGATGILGISTGSAVAAHSFFGT